MPGVSVTTDVRSGPVAPDTAPGAVFFAVGIAERGSTAAAIEVQSYPDFVDKCGPWVAYGALADAIRCYFEEGGSRAYVARVVGPAAAVGNLVLQDRAAVPVNTLRVEAKDPGAWSAGLTVQVEDGGQAGTFRLTVRYGGTGGPLVERYDNLATVAAAVAALSTSAYVRGVDLASPSGVNAIPAVRAATALSAGTDDRGAVTAAIMTGALARFGGDLGPGLVAIPGQSTAAVGAAVMAHAAANRRCSALAAVRGATDAAKIAEAQALRDNVGADGAGVFAPWVVIPDGAGGRRTVDPVGYVAGCWARAHLAEGPFRAGAGSLAAARFVLDVDEQLDRARGDALDDGEVNAIRVITIPDGRRVETYGWRSLPGHPERARLECLTGGRGHRVPHRRRAGPHRVGPQRRAARRRPGDGRPGRALSAAGQREAGRPGLLGRHRARRQPPCAAAGEHHRRQPRRSGLADGGAREHPHHQGRRHRQPVGGPIAWAQPRRAISWSRSTA
jgi:hypothetical protein